MRKEKKTLSSVRRSVIESLAVRKSFLSAQAAALPGDNIQSFCKEELLLDSEDNLITGVEKLLKKILSL